MKNELYVEQLIFEVTRRCNMACEHCLRGEAENIDISKEIIDKTLSQISSIRDITFTGGEPSLNSDIIIYTINKIIELGIPLYSFFIATNGLVYNPELVTALIELYAYCVEYNGESECIGGLAISIDQFHSKISDKNLYRYKALSFYNDSKTFTYKPEYIIREGNAEFNGIGKKIPNYNSDGLILSDDYNGYSIETLYINAKGDIVNNCDMSYSTQDECTLGNILETPLMDLVAETQSCESA